MDGRPNTFRVGDCMKGSPEGKAGKISHTFYRGGGNFCEVRSKNAISCYRVQFKLFLMWCVYENAIYSKLFFLLLGEIFFIEHSNAVRLTPGNKENKQKGCVLRHTSVKQGLSHWDNALKTA